MLSYAKSQVLFRVLVNFQVGIFTKPLLNLIGSRNHLAFVKEVNGLRGEFGLNFLDIFHDDAIS